MSHVSPCPPVELRHQGAERLPHQQDRPLELVPGGLAPLVGLDQEDGPVGDALGREAVPLQRVVSVHAARQDTWNKVKTVVGYK